MASLTMNMRVRYPSWREDHLRLMAELGGDPDMAIVFVLRNTDYSLDGGKTWKRFGQDLVERVTSDK